MKQADLLSSRDNYIDNSSDENLDFAFYYHKHLLKVGGGISVLILLMSLYLGIGYMRETRFTKGKTRRNISKLIKGDFHIIVNEEDVVVAKGIPDDSGFSIPGRDIIFLGKDSVSSTRDVYWAFVKLSTSGIPMGTPLLINLSNSPHIDEAHMVVSKSHVAFYVPGQSIKIIDFSKKRNINLEDFSSIKKAYGKMKNWLKTRRFFHFPQYEITLGQKLTKIAFIWKDSTLYVAGVTKGKKKMKFEFDLQNLVFDGDTSGLQLFKTEKIVKGLPPPFCNTFKF
jgi:hypothetical protein